MKELPNVSVHDDNSPVLLGIRKFIKKTFHNLSTVYLKRLLEQNVNIRFESSFPRSVSLKLKIFYLHPEINYKLIPTLLSLRAVSLYKIINNCVRHSFKAKINNNLNVFAVLN